MMKLMRLHKIVSFSVVLALLTSVAAGLSVMNSHGSSASPAWTMITRFVVFLVFGLFGLTVARACRLKGSLIVTTEEWATVVRDFVNFGVLPGAVLGVINYLCFFPYRYSPAVVPQIRGIKTVYDSFILSLNSGMGEEILYRLFIFSCLLFMFRNLYARIEPLWPQLTAILPVALSLVVSSLLFALVHSFSAFTAAFFGGMLLGLVYLKSGIEGAIVAHVIADFLFFSAVYLS